jgi:hypothetical protein
MNTARVFLVNLVGIALALILLAGACGTGDAGPEGPTQAVTSWVHEGTTYPVVSGIAVPLVGYSFWDPQEVKEVEVPEGQGVRVHLSDQQIDCSLYPFLYRMRIPPLPTRTGATISLTFPRMATLDSVSTNFDVETLDSSSGLSTDGVRGSARFTGAETAIRVAGWLEYDSQETQPELPNVEVSGAFDVPLCTADIHSFAPGTDIENAAGTVELVKGLEPYRTETFEKKYRDIPEVDLFVIVPEANESVLLVPSEVPIDDTGRPLSTASDKYLLTLSDMPDEFRQDGIKVVFSGKVGEKPFQYENLNRIPLKLTKISLIDDP